MILCYVDNIEEDFADGEAVAYFTNLSLSEQWGDDWNDAPYDCNAGEPYCTGQILKLRIDKGNLETPSDLMWNTPFSVQDINSGIIAWLFERYKENPVVIRAGVSVEEFEKLLQQAGGRVIGQETGKDE